MYNFGQFGNMFQQFPQPNNFQNQSQFITKQVTNIEEAKAYIVDPFNSYLFVDINSGKIYMKKMNNNGMSDFYVFSIEENVKQADPMAEINQRLSNIENIIGGLYDKSISSNESNAKSNGDDSATNDDEISKTKSSDVSAGSANGKRKE